MSARLVSIQFMLNTKKQVPDGIPDKGLETKEQVEKRQNFSGTGKLLFENVEKVSIAQFVSVLLSHGYVLVDAWAQERMHKKGGRTYYVVRFTLSREENAAPSEEFLKIQEAMTERLKQMAISSFWKVRAFWNPFFLDGEEVPGEHAISIDAAERFPRFENGQLIMVWPRDAQGNQIRDRPKVPISPFGELRYNGGQLTVVAVNGSAM